MDAFKIGILNLKVFNANWLIRCKPKMKYSYLFYIEGLDKEVTITDSTEKQARKQLWDSLNSPEQNAVVQVDCLDVTDLEV